MAILSKLGKYHCNKYLSLPKNDSMFYRNPTPDRLFDSWHPYNANTKYIKILGTKIDSLLHNRILKDSSFEQNREKIEDMLSSDTEAKPEIVYSSSTIQRQQYNPYHLSNVNNGYEENNRISRNFDVSTTNAAKNTDYYFYLRRIYSFWYEYLPSLYKNYQDRTGRSSSEQETLLENGRIVIDKTKILLWQINPFQQLQSTNTLSFQCSPLSVYCLPSSVFVFIFWKRITKVSRRRRLSYDKNLCSGQGCWLTEESSEWDKRGIHQQNM